MTTTPEVSRPQTASPFVGAFATWGLHVDHDGTEEQAALAREHLQVQIELFKASEPRTWVVEKTYEFVFTAVGAEDSPAHEVHRLEWEGVEDRIAFSDERYSIKG
jgi:hypothetical protein